MTNHVLGKMPYPDNPRHLKKGGAPSPPELRSWGPKLFVKLVVLDTIKGVNTQPLNQGGFLVVRAHNHHVVNQDARLSPHTQHQLSEI